MTGIPCSGLVVAISAGHPRPKQDHCASSRSDPHRVCRLACARRRVELVDALDLAQSEYLQCLR